MKYRSAVSGLLAFGFALCPSLVGARVAPMSLKELVDASDLIVLAAETKLEDGPTHLKLGEDDVRFPIKIATARVLEVWKGNPVREVRYLASPSWICDISDAKVGERVVLFLVKPKDWPFRVIAHSGRGRMPLRDVKGKTYATMWADDVRLPKGVMTISGPKTKYEFIRSIDLSLLRSTVKAVGRTDILVVGSFGMFALAGLTWFFSSRRLNRISAPPGENRVLDGTRPRDVSFKTWLRTIAKVEFLVATLLAFVLLWCHT